MAEQKEPILQENTNRFFSNGVKSQIKEYFKANNFRLAKSAAAADRIFSTLMGDVVEPRREFIQSHAKYVTNIDV